MDIEKSLRISKQQRQGCLQTQFALMHLSASCKIVHSYNNMLYFPWEHISVHGKSFGRMKQTHAAKSEARATALTLAVPTWPWALTLQKPVQTVSQTLTWHRVGVRWSKEEQRKNCGAGAADHHPSPCLSALGVHPCSTLEEFVWESGTQVLSTLQNSPHFPFTSPLTSHKLTWIRRPQLFAQTEASWNI